MAEIFKDWVAIFEDETRLWSIDVYETGPDGTLVMPEPLFSGDYELHEVQAPYGYLLSETPVKFVINSEQYVYCKGRMSNPSNTVGSRFTRSKAERHSREGGDSG